VKEWRKDWEEVDESGQKEGKRGKEGKERGKREERKRGKEEGEGGSCMKRTGKAKERLKANVEEVNEWEGTGGGRQEKGLKRKEKKRELCARDLSGCTTNHGLDWADSPCPVLSCPVSLPLLDGWMKMEAAIHSPAGAIESLNEYNLAGRE